MRTTGPIGKVKVLFLEDFYMDSKIKKWQLNRTTFIGSAYFQINISVQKSFTVYIKQGGEVESRGGAGVIESSSSPVSPLASYWRAPGLESPARMHR